MHMNRAAALAGSVVTRQSHIREIQRSAAFNVHTAAIEAIAALNREVGHCDGVGTVDRHGLMYFQLRKPCRRCPVSRKTLGEIVAAPSAPLLSHCATAPFR